MKKCLLGLAIVFAAVSANAAYLYWQVNSGESGLDYNYAVLYATDASTTVALAEAYTPMAREMQVDLTDAFYDPSSETSTTYNFSQGSGTTWTFYVELYNYDSSAGTMSQAGHTREEARQTYSDLASSGAIVDPNLSISPVITAWSGGPYAVPEPTSGILMMLGLALVGLRRRKV